MRQKQRAMSMMLTGVGLPLRNKGKMHVLCAGMGGDVKEPIGERKRACQWRNQRDGSAAWACDILDTRWCTDL